MIRRNAILGMVLFGISTASNAGSVTGYIEFLQAGRAVGGYVLVLVDQTPTNQPACATDQRFAVNPNDNAGKALMALLLSAQASNKRVAITGMDNCDIYNGFESISYMRLLEN